MVPVHLQTALEYIRACSCTPSQNNFQTLLSNDVELSHQTKGVFIYARGIKEVSTLFEKYLFKNTSNIDVKSIKYRPTKNGIVLKFIVEEDKIEEGKVNRYVFEEMTRFKFNNLDQKISFIASVIKRTSVKAKL